MIQKNSSRILAITGLAVLSAIPQYAAEVRHLTLTEAVHLAVSQNHALKIARAKVVEHEQKKAGERSSYFPSISNQSNILHITDLQNVVIPEGALGKVGGAYVPSENVTLPQGRSTFFTSGTQISQPLTQLIRIHQANLAAAAEVAASKADVKNAETQVALQVHALYYGILIARLQKQAAEQQTAYAGERLRESEDVCGKAMHSTSRRSRARPACWRASNPCSPRICSSLT